MKSERKKRDSDSARDSTALPGLSVGTVLGHYEIVELLGRGGMGEVFRARDTKLGRDVAIKILPPEVSDSRERRSRFEREAKAVAALNHPNIVVVHSVEEVDELSFITMELVRGKTLSELLPAKGLPLEKFFDIAIPLAGAVAAAHQAGITHRDLKPDNVVVADDGRVKVLDFGLATAPRVNESDAEGATLTRTREGVILGTPAYMSPEQAQGKPVDSRSDNFALGVIFYEMLTGRRPFAGDTVPELLSAIVKDAPPPVSDVRPDVPRELSRVVRRCLEKEPSRRLQSALDLRNELEELRRELDSGELVVSETASRSGRRGTSQSWWLVGGVVGLGVLALVRGWTTDSPRSDLPRLVNPVQVTSAEGVENFPAWSPDGGRIAYTSDQGGNPDIWVSQLGGGPPANFTADHEGEDREPAWSPDGSRIAFASERDGGGIYVMPAIGGPSSRISPRAPESVANYNSPRWSPDGNEVAYIFIDNESVPVIEIISLATREARRLPITSSPGYHWDLSWSPDGRFFAYVRSAGRPLDARVSRLWVLRASDAQFFAVTDGMSIDWSPTWSADGRRLFFLSSRGGSFDLWQQRIAADGTPEGEAEAITVGVGMRQAALANDGSRLVYSRGRRVSNLWRVPLHDDRESVWEEAAQLTFEQAFIKSVDLSPGGDRLLLDSDRGGNPDLWLLPVHGGEMTQVTTSPAPDEQARWSPDGQKIGYVSYRSGHWDLWVVPVDGGPAVPLTESPAPDFWPSWSPDGGSILFYSRGTDSVDVFAVPADGGEAQPLTTESSTEYLPLLSPDGSWLAFASSRDDGVFRLWRTPASGGAPQRITQGPAMVFRWSPDGSRIYFLGALRGSNDIWAVTLEDGTERQVTRLSGRTGTLGTRGLAVGGGYLYFTWENDLGDIWVMDVAEN